METFKPLQTPIFRAHALAVLILTIISASVSGQTNRWLGDGSANQWNFSAPNWTNGVYVDGEHVIFNDAGSNNAPVDLTVTVSPGSVVVNATKNYAFSGAGGLAGATDLTKTNTGELKLVTSNSYSGVTRVSAGRLTVQNSNALGTTTGGTVVTNTGSILIEGDGLSIPEPLALFVPVDDQGLGPVNSALNNLANTNTWSGAITLGVTTPLRSTAGLLTLTSATAVAGPGGLAVIGAGDVRITSGIASSVASLQAYGPGTLTITGNNDSSGSIVAYAQSKIIASPGALGSGMLYLPGTLEIATGGSASFANQLIVYGGRLRVSGGTATYSRSGYPQIGSTATFETVAASDQLVFNSAISDFIANGYIYVTGPGTVSINAGSTSFSAFTGYWFLQDGILRLNHVNALGNPGGGSQRPIFLLGGTLQTGVDAGGVFSIQTLVQGNATMKPGRSTSGAGVSNYFGSLYFASYQLTVTPGANLTAGSTADLGFGQADVDLITLDYGDAPLNVQNSGGVNARVTLRSEVRDPYGPPHALVKNGNGTLVLLAANTYRGGTVISNGTLHVANTTGSGTGTGNVTVHDGGTLIGNGKISGPVTVKSGGTLAPGASIGALVISNSLAFESGATNVVEVNLATSTNDLVLGLTNVIYAGTLMVSNVGSQGFTNGSAFKLFDSLNYSGAFTAIQPTHPGAGLAWDVNTLASDGILRVMLEGNLVPQVNNPIPDQSGTYGSAFNYAFPVNTFSDPDAGQVLSYTASGLPTGIVFGGPTRSFGGTPTAVGTNSIMVTATDNGSPPLSTNDTFDIVIAKAPLVVTANNTNRAYGDANPSLSGIITGVTNGDIITATFNTTAVPGSPPGNYPITPDLQDPGNKLGNYVVTTNLGTLTINGVTLQFSTSSGSPSFCWPSNAVDFALEFTDSLTSPVSWHSVTNGIVTNDTTFCYMATPEPEIASRFYRLRLP